MRVRGVVLGVLGLGVSAAAAAGQGPRRGAVLLPPVPADPADVRVVARAAAEELPAHPGSTPVNRPPVWPGRPDPYVRPAGGTAPPPLAKPEPTLAKGIDKLKGTFVPEKPARPAPPPAPAADAQTPFRGTTPTGAPVYAGPPAYRWYGWGSVTPGGNPFAPAGQYPTASANWHSITGATPGAFPVPVADPTRPPPGSDPPAYATTPTRRPPPAAPPPPPARPPAPAATSSVDPVYLPPTPAPVPVATPTLTAPPTPAVAAPITLAPLLPRPADPAVPAAPLPALPVLPPVTVPAAGVEAAKPAPAADEPARWQPSATPAPAAPAGGNWTPGGK
ncbi:MAG: hypothetical protein C0501_02195 [Isosphaera sp.]|nr:hypothetical protein [Isosphaera sp.]